MVQKIEATGKEKLWKVFSIMDIYGTFYNRNKEIVKHCFNVLKGICKRAEFYL